MTIALPLKTGFIARDASGRWFHYETEPQTIDDTCMRQWALGGRFSELRDDLLDLATLPTYHEPDWRRTKFQVTPSTDTGRLGTCQCCNKNKANSVICQDCIDEHMD